MTRKHFELFAEAIRAVEDLEKREYLYSKIMPVCSASNQLFKISQFRKACGLPDDIEKAKEELTNV
jgi:hypothetical protein